MDAKEKLVSKADLKLPDAFLKRWLVAANKELTTESVEKDYPLMQADLAWQLIKNKITEEQAFKMEESELLDYAKQSVLMQFQQYGLMHIPDEQLEAYAKQTLTNEDERRKMVERIFEQKIVEYLKETIKVENKAVSMKEFEELFK
jgi:trigger factor